ncbi:protein DBF4 homolog A-like isoform X2 [Varroa jacobsoni]|uniref:protein DBF4 homolog A-like isoform X2 n=1 Tax=Varroa jacobsoni TaxID=62625 RepID=UPI000BF287F4|nr:protein DBF4 homolog A-like isoform X2 [Varroa jacobsoni]
MPSVAHASVPVKTPLPLRGKRVFMDTKSPSTLLRRQLESLGARVETFFSKDIWCVITDKQLRDQDKRGIGLLSKVISQNSSTSSPNPGGKRSPFLNRTQALLQAAQRREVKERGNRSLSTTKIKDEVQSVAQECRQWDIPLLSVKTAQNSVAKLVKKYHPEGVVPSTSEKKALTSSSALLRKTVSESHVGKTTRIDSDDFIKLEDVRQLHKPVYKTFSRQTWPQVMISPPMSGLGATLSPFTPADECERIARKRRLKEHTDRTGEKRLRENDGDRTKSHQRLDRTYPTQDYSRKRKSIADTKQRYCELCQEYYALLRPHLESSGHQRKSAGAVIELQKMLGEFQTDIFKDAIPVSTEPSSPLSSVYANCPTTTSVPAADNRVKNSVVEFNETTSIVRSLPVES